jgi:hypothetical protein
VGINVNQLRTETQTYLQQELSSAQVQLSAVATTNNRRHLEEEELTYSFVGTAQYSSLQNIPSTTELWANQQTALQSPNYLQRLQQTVNPNIVQTTLSFHTTDPPILVPPPPVLPPVLTPTPPVSAPTNNPNNGVIVPDDNDTTSKAPSNVPMIAGVVGAAAAVLTVGFFLVSRRRRNHNRSLI